MAKRTAPTAPEWFRPDAYDAAANLDAGDWLLNLTLRCWLRAVPNPTTEDALRRVGPVLRRGDAAQMRAMHLADVHRWIDRFHADEWGGDPPFEEACQRPQLPADVWHAMLHGRIRDGIIALRAADVHIVGRRLADEEIDARRTLVARVVRLDLALPDDVLHADLQRYLQRERHRLAKMGGEQPYREAARSKKRPGPRLCETLAKLRLLLYLDLARWAVREPKKSHGARMNEADLMALAGVEPGRRAELRTYARITARQMELHALFARLDRSANKRHTRGKT